MKEGQGERRGRKCRGHGPRARWQGRRPAAACPCVRRGQGPQGAKAWQH